MGNNLLYTTTVPLQLSTSKLPVAVVTIHIIRIIIIIAKYIGK